MLLNNFKTFFYNDEFIIFQDFKHITSLTVWLWRDDLVLVTFKPAFENYLSQKIQLLVQALNSLWQFLIVLDKCFDSLSTILVDLNEFSKWEAIVECPVDCFQYDVQILLESLIIYSHLKTLVVVLFISIWKFWKNFKLLTLKIG